MAQQIIIDIETLYSSTETAKLARLEEYEEKARELAGNGNEVVLTGQGPVWLYLRVAHSLHGKVRTLKYDSPVTGSVVVFDHNPDAQTEPQRREERKEINVEELGNRVIGAAIKVHRVLGPGLLESAYQKCLEYELTQSGIRVKSETMLPLQYGEITIGAGYRLDMLIEDTIVLENKTVERLMPIHEAQLLTYLKLTGCRLGFLVNWNAPTLKDGLKRMVHNL